MHLGGERVPEASQGPHTPLVMIAGWNAECCTRCRSSRAAFAGRVLWAPEPGSLALRDSDRPRSVQGAPGATRSLPRVYIFAVQDPSCRNGCCLWGEATQPGAACSGQRRPSFLLTVFPLSPLVPSKALASFSCKGPSPLASNDACSSGPIRSHFFVTRRAVRGHG